MRDKKFINAKYYLRNFSKEEISKSFVDRIIGKINQEENNILTSHTTSPTPKKLSMRDFRQIFTLTTNSEVLKQ